MFTSTPQQVIRMVLPLLMLMLALATPVALAQSASNRPIATPKIRLLLPHAGESLSPGQKIKIAWQVDLPPNLDLSWCEQEILLSLDGGKTLQYRISPELSPTQRTFEWTVPNLPTDQAVLDIRFGSEFSTMRFEKSKPQIHSTFRILPKTTNLEEVDLHITASDKLSPGDQISFSWDSSVSELADYEVMISYDQGGHFHSLGHTELNSFSWLVPDDFSGLVNFKVIAHKLDGGKVESITNTEPLVVTRNQ